MDSELKGILESGASQISGDLLDPAITGRLCRLYDEISLFNPSYGLVNAEGRDLVVRHILDCLAPYGIFRQNIEGTEIRMADLGSGAGLPGLVVASAFPQWRMDLVERMGRRAGFLLNSVAAMGLNANVNVVKKDLSEVHNQYDVVTFRAFRQFKDIISDLDRILAPGGMIFAYKSSDENIGEEIAVVDSYRGCSFEVSKVDYQVPMLDAKRQMLILRKGKTASQQ